MKKSPSVLLLGLAASFMTTGVAEAADIKERNLKIAAVLQADSPYVISAQRVATLIGEKSGNKMKAKVFAGGSLGGDVAVVSSLQGGTVDMTMVASGILSGVIKEFGLFSIPMLFNEPKDAYVVLDSPVGKKFLDRLPAKNLVGLGWWEYGYHNITNSKRPVTKWEDIQGLKIRTQQIPALIDTFNTLGANAVPMPFTEVYTALETKAVDAQENTLASIETSKFGEVQKYLSTTRHVYDPIVVLFSKKVWDQLGADEQKIIQEAVAEVTSYERKLSQDREVQALEGLKKRGMIVTDFPQSERDRMAEKLRPVMEKYTQQADPALVKELFAEIDKVRGRK